MISAGFSRFALDEALGISKGMVARYENGDRKDSVKPGLVTLVKMNKILFPKQPTQGTESDKVAVELSTVSLEDLVAELKRRGAQTITF